MNVEYIPKPSRKATVFVVHTPRIRIMRMSTSGWSERVSLRTHRTRATTPNAIRPIVFADNQCHLDVWLTATSTETSPTVSRTAPAQLIRPGTRTGDSGTTKYVATVAIAIGISGSQKSQWKDRLS